MIGKTIVISLFGIVALILLVGITLDCLGYYEKKERKEKSFMANDEFDYGHNVNHKDYE